MQWVAPFLGFCDGGGRTYRFLINHSPEFSRFEMVSIWSNVPHKLVGAGAR